MVTRIEDEIKDTFYKKFPFSLLSNVILYRNDRSVRDIFANEIDCLFHYRKGSVDYLNIIEVKQREIYADNHYKVPTSSSQWILNYDNQKKDIKKQVIDQATALGQFCSNIKSNIPVIKCWIVDKSNRPTKVITDQKKSNLKLMTFQGFKEEISKIECVIKVEHSIFLREIRKGIVNPEIGHPELRNAIQFIKICRQSLDDQIYRFFNPSKKLYALNGCAGMGKSVLLAYSIFVFATDYAMYLKDGKNKLEKFKKNNILPSKDDRWIFVYAVKKKQIEILEQYYKFIYQKMLQMVDTQLQPLQPKFKKWEGNIDERCNILVIDEAHDLTTEEQKKIAEWQSTKPIDKYLLIACDRNQAPKRKNSDENIIRGINFSGHSTRLNRIYRCPFPVYVASIGVLFRWFAPGGVGVDLSSEKLREHFGFNTRVKHYGVEMALTMRNDCHPGNNWQQTVDIAEDCSTVYTHLSQSNFERQDVLWACFEKMEPEFDYTEISQKYTFVDLRGEDADNEIDKNIKGQEFAIVVVEGLPKDINPPDLIAKHRRNRDDAVLEKKMWDCRKNVYITCSRASAFLYFIASPKKIYKENLDELKKLIKQVTNPVRKRHSSGQEWAFRVNIPDPKRKPSVFNDIEKGTLNPDEETKEETKKIEVCQNNSSGKYFIYLRDIDRIGEKIELITYDGAFKRIFEKKLFHEIESRSIDKLLAENLITLKQLEFYNYYSRNSKEDKPSPTQITPTPPNKDIYTCSVRNAFAKMVIKNNSYIILKGSTAVKDNQESLSVGNRKIKSDLIRSQKLVLDEEKDVYEFTSNVPFKSSSAAASVIAGSSRSGPYCFGCQSKTGDYTFYGRI